MAQRYETFSCVEDPACQSCGKSVHSEAELSYIGHGWGFWGCVECVSDARDQVVAELRELRTLQGAVELDERDSARLSQLEAELAGISPEEREELLAPEYSEPEAVCTCQQTDKEVCHSRGCELHDSSSEWNARRRAVTMTERYCELKEVA